MGIQYSFCTVPLRRLTHQHVLGRVAIPRELASETLTDRLCYDSVAMQCVSTEVAQEGPDGV